MSSAKESEITCDWESSSEETETELCCCYVEGEDGTYDNPCMQEKLDGCCC